MTPHTLFLLAVAVVCLAFAGLALKTGWAPCIVYSGRFIARREREPTLFWLSVTALAVSGALAAGAAAVAVS